MQPVMFTFRPGLSREDQDRVLDMINSLDGVTRAARLKPDAHDPDTARMACAFVDDVTDPGRIVVTLSHIPQIEVASSPSARGLIP
jgi:hypothetical protein